jgi:4-amino-4-deoxy-L-arabinose transferase-like glycosyltransferase
LNAPVTQPGAEGPLGWPVIAFAGLFGCTLLLTSLHPAYGYFVDELGYLACAERLAFGYVDHPPLAPTLLAVNRSLLGDSLPAMRWLPALCGAGTALASAWMARRLGAARFGQLLAALCVSVAPVYLGVFSIFSTNCFEVLFWSITACVLIELSRSGDARLWWRDFSCPATWGLAGPSRVVWVGSAKNVIAPI